ncbi:MAG TPA: heme lyase CcmF/NrfE family subunit, partial [Burkholderiales bacterium]|nr:heme lyase CcmF/NrfE family subunit [Burkholderiales bacterium]
RPWTLAAWGALTLGIALGSYWAYYELGWGGWWFWDPVENASFMPWLVGTALIHSLAVTEKRGGFKAWTVLLAILAFALSLLGTFLVRSGVLTSVHAFATDPRRGVFILAFLAIVVGGALALFAWRAQRVRGGGNFELLSRESLLLTNNVLLLAAAGSVMLGTLYPLAIDALGLGKLSVGPPYFEAVFVPLMAPALFLMGVAPLARWKKAELPELAVRLRWALGVAVAMALIVPFAMGRFSALVGFGIWLAVWIIASAATTLLGRVKRTRSYYGMLLAHVGIAVFVIGVTLVKGYEAEKDVRMAPGDTVSLGGYVFRLDGVGDAKGPNYLAARATMTVTREGRAVATLRPERRVYRVQESPMTEASILYGLFRHLYVALSEPVEGNAWIVRVHYKPFISWIWLGCILMALGGLLAASDRRYRVTAREPQAARHSGPARHSREGGNPALP